VIEKYKEFGMRLKAKAFNRYRDLIRRPVLEHQKKTFDSIYILHPNERATGQKVVDTTDKDEFEIINELGDIAPEGDPQLFKMQQLEAKFDEVSGMLLNVYQAHDKVMHDICTLVGDTNQTTASIKDKDEKN
jgi:hypothetical protein